MSSLGFGLACLGLIVLSLSMKRHYLQAWPDSRHFEKWKVPNRVFGYALVFLSLLPCVLLEGPWIGLVLWLSMLAGAAFLQTFVLTYRPSESWLFGSASVVLIVVGLLQ